MAMAARILSTIMLSAFSFFLGFYQCPEILEFCTVHKHRESEDVLLLGAIKVQVNLVSSENELCSDSSEWNYNIQFTSTSVVPKFINRNLLIDTSISESNEEKIWLRITKDDSIYIRSRLTGKEALPQKKAVYLFGSLKISDQLSFNQLIHESSAILNTSDYSNTDYGKYKVQAIYVSGGDSIPSNVIVVRFYESCDSETK